MRATFVGEKELMTKLVDVPDSLFR